MKRKELELKQKELELKEKELNQKDSIQKNPPSTIKTEKRKLRYLFYANGGLVGYFNDGSVVGCPRCDLAQDNIKALFKKEPHDYYSVDKDGTIRTGKNGKVKPNRNNDEWAMIDYEWIVEVK